MDTIIGVILLVFGMVILGGFGGLWWVYRQFMGRW